MKPIKTILYPTDFSRSSEYAFGLACSIARDHGARLLVLHVVPKFSPVAGPSDKAALQKAEHTEQDLKTYQREMEKKLHHLQPQGGKVDVEHLLKEGEPGAAILQALHEKPCDLIVMGTHGKTEQERKLLGSVAEEVMLKASCPVLVVKTPHGSQH